MEKLRRKSPGTLRNKFLNDLGAGHEGEKLLCAILRAAGIDCRQTDGKKHDVEAFIEDRWVHIEVKYDLKSQLTNNLAIEYYNPKTCKPSGLMATESELWCIALPNKTVFACKTESLRLYFHNEKFLRDLPSVGDGNSSCRLYNKSVLLNAIFKELTVESSNEVLINMVKG